MVLRFACVFALCSSLGCGGTSRSHAATQTTPGERCAEPATVAPPGASLDCEVTAPPLDSMPHGVTRALHLACARPLFDPAMVATSDGALVLTQTTPLDANLSTGHVVTVTADGAHVEDIPELGQANNVTFSPPGVASSKGTSWLFATGPNELTARRGSDAGWTSSVAAEFSTSDYAYLTGASIVDDQRGYVTFTGRNQWPHLLTWDGTCWTDDVIEETKAFATALAADTSGEAWSAVLTPGPAEEPSSEVHLRGPGTDIRLELDASVHLPTIPGPIRLLPGGPDGAAPATVLAVRFPEEIRVFENDRAQPTTWRSELLPESGLPWNVSGDCDSLRAETPSSDEDPCLGQTTCVRQLSGSSSGFDLVRTESGETFAMWINYDTTATNSLAKQCRGGELPGCYCAQFEQSGSGTADLVLAHLTEAGAVLSHFRFELDTGIVYQPRGVAMAARGETLLIAADLDGSEVWDLTYIEIDSRQLP